MNEEVKKMKDEDLGLELLKRRICGETWVTIADELELGSKTTVDSARAERARARFRELTGITDTRSKGVKLLRLVLEDARSTAAVT